MRMGPMLAPRPGPRWRVRYRRWQLAAHRDIVSEKQAEVGVNWFPVLLVAHVALAVSLLAPSLLLPFLLGHDAVRAPGPLTQALMTMQGTGSVVIAIGLAVTGIGLVVSIGTQVVTQPWLLVALGVYAANLLTAAFISRPNLRRLMRLSDASPETWRRRARRQRYVAYGMAAATGLIGFLMSTKPVLW